MKSPGILLQRREILLAYGVSEIFNSGKATVSKIRSDKSLDVFKDQKYKLNLQSVCIEG